MLVVLIFVTVSALVISRSLDLTISGGQIVRASNKRAEEYFKNEETLARAATWLRSHSQDLVYLFRRDNFYSLFDRSSPSSGENQEVSPVASRLKLKGTNATPLLASVDALGRTEFPVSETSMGEPFELVLEFAKLLDDAVAEVKISLLDAAPSNPDRDFGDPALGNPPPETDFKPVFRLDVMNSSSRGSHLYSYLVGELKYHLDIGFLGEQFVELRQSCDSYSSKNGAYSSDTRQANCLIGSGGPVRVHQSQNIYGSVRTATQVEQSAPWNGGICDDFNDGCPRMGDVCEGSSCGIPSLPTYEEWSTYCPSNQGNLTVNTNQTLTVASAAATDRCWNTVRVNPNRTLTLSSTETPYFFETLDIANNGKIEFAPNPSHATIEIYVRQFAGDSFNASQAINSTNKPYQLKIHYLGSADLTLNGNAQMYAFIVAPYAGIEVSGNYDFHGGIKAKRLLATGAGKLRYDQSGSETKLEDIRFSVRQMGQHYR